MDKVKCFWTVLVEDQVEMDLRRYASHKDPDHDCTVHPHKYHNASVTIGRGLAADCPKISDSGYGPVHGDLWPHDNPRWPTQCVCGRIFKDTDEWQFNPNRLYRIVNTGEIMTDSQLPAGAMRDVSQWHQDLDPAYCADANGVMLQVKLPDGVWWNIDGPASNTDMKQPGWTRTGDIPNVTARPSILTSQYHGWLTDGYLIPC